MKLSVTILLTLTVVVLAHAHTPANYQVPGAVISGGMYMPLFTALQYCKDNSTCTSKPAVMNQV